MTIVEFLKRRIAEDEDQARAAAARGDVWQVQDEQIWADIDHRAGVVHASWERESATPAELAHIARHDPARVLAECQAKRAIIEQVSDIEWTGSYAVRDVVLGHLAAVYADHPDYQPEWRP